MKETQVDLWGWVETNINWTRIIKSKGQHYRRKIFRNFTIFTSGSNDSADFYQRGGTCIGVIDKLTGRGKPNGNELWSVHFNHANSPTQEMEQ
eukprot:719774-Ditylum_brightwellii.AAC.1